MSRSKPPGKEAQAPAAPTDISQRREFLKVSAAAAGATLLTSCVGGGGGESAPLLGAPEVDPLTRFDHLVVVMFENRSLDNILGYLYPASSPWNGLARGGYSNPVPSYIKDGNTVVAARKSPGTKADFQNPNPDPGESYPHVNTQLFGTVDPWTNEFLTPEHMKFPFNAPAQGTPATMQGFVQDYCNTFRSWQGRNPTFDEYRVIMDGFTPEQLPVLSTLAQSFAAYDAWFCAVPSQTGCNRAFFHASTSSDNVFNTPYEKWLEQNTAPTIFNRLEDSGRTWKIYYDDTQLVSLTGLLHAPVLFPYWLKRFWTMEDFKKDVAAGTLPDYAFIEPRMFINHNDFHPPAPLVDGGGNGSPSDVRAGDLLVHEIYTAVSQSPRRDETLLLFTFDEHGGCYDHVAPPEALPPQIPQAEGEMGFFFNRLGVRVPAVVVSSYTDPMIVQRTVHHAAVIRTLCRKFDMPHLTERDRTAPDLRDAINRTTPLANWPKTVPPMVPLEALNTDPNSPEVGSAPLNDLETFIVGLALTWFEGAEPTAASIPKTVGEAHARLKPLTAGAFGHT